MSNSDQMRDLGIMAQPKMSEGDYPVGSPSILEALRSKQRILTAQLENVKAAIAAVEKNPDVLQVLELLVKAR